jgi:Probable Zinc-ribbon domain
MMMKNKKHTLADTNPELVREWHLSKNAPLTPKDVSPGSHKKVWWLCDNRHEWETSIAYRIRRGDNCPYCSGRKVCKDNSLEALNLKLAREWHPSKNEPLTPSEVRPGSRIKVWWICRKGHEWDATINNRSQGQGCPFCVGKRVGKDNSLLTLKPLIAEDWHPTRNAPLTPKDVTARSGKKAWWLCRNGHEWRVAISTKGNCPFCSGRSASKENCLQTANPVVSKEWHPTKNAPLTPNDVTPNSNKMMWWLCQKGHEWAAQVEHRMRGCGCPYCSGRRVTKENCLLTVNPRLAREWHPTKNAPLTPKDVTAHSSKSVWWLCGRGHEWSTKVNDRSNERGCPFCSGKRPQKEDCIETVSPLLAAEWHPTKNRSYTPKDVSPYSNKHIWWICKAGHEEQERVIDRYQRGGCVVCVLRRTVPRLFESDPGGGSP